MDSIKKKNVWSKNLLKVFRLCLETFFQRHRVSLFNNIVSQVSRVSELK